MKTRIILLLLTLLPCVSTGAAGTNLQKTTSPDFIPESEMKSELLQMLADFMVYVRNDYQEQPSNSRGEACATFKSHSTGVANEDGVRTNADLSMVCAFLSRYGRERVQLPEGLRWQDIDTMARRSLVYAYSTHKACRLADCKDGKYWGSTSGSDNMWESSLWAMSVAYSAFFQWNALTEVQRQSVHDLLAAECRYELERQVPTGFQGDTKAEENGWEACVLAAALGLFPDDAEAPQWFDRLRLFAINSYSHSTDAHDSTVIDPQYDRRTVADLYRGSNLYSDWTLQNHNFFHTSYQNVVMQELGEAALALELFQRQLYGKQRWHTQALMHNNLRVQHEVLDWLALADGELAMPNGNDWSLFLYDQITSFTTNATFLRDADALMLENRAFQMIRARQRTTPDGSWLLRSDIGARRMGVEAHRVMMTWLMHELHPTASLRPSTFEDFRQRHSSARLFPCQNIVRGHTRDRFSVFSWAPGIRSYTGYFTDNNMWRNKTVVPFKKYNTGNLLGWTVVDSCHINAVPVVPGRYRLEGDAWSMEGRLLTNDSALDHHFVLCSTAGNALVYLDRITARRPVTVRREEGGLLAISMDPFTRERRTFYTATDSMEVTGDSLQIFTTPWLNVDNHLGVVAGRITTVEDGEKGKLSSYVKEKVLSKRLGRALHDKMLGERIARVVLTDIAQPDSVGVWLLSEKSDINQKGKSGVFQKNTEAVPSRIRMVEKQVETLEDCESGKMAFGEKENNNSILTARLYTLYNNVPHHYAAGETVASRYVIYYSNVDRSTTSLLSSSVVSLAPFLPSGYTGLLTCDPDGTQYVVIMRI